jgi:hypothetical protein
MEITTNIDKETALRTHKVTGTLSLDDLMAKLGEIYSIPDFQPDMNVLWDLRSADLASFSSSDIQKVRDFVGYKWGTGGVQPRCTGGFTRHRFRPFEDVRNVIGKCNDEHASGFS